MLGTYRTGPAFLLTYMGTAPANAEASGAGVLARDRPHPDEQVNERELARAKAYLLGNLTMDRRTTARDAWYLAFFEVVGAGWNFPERYAAGRGGGHGGGRGAGGAALSGGADRGGAAAAEGGGP